MTPFARYSSLRGNRDGALVTGAAIQAVIDTALMTADRAQFTMGMSLELAQEIKLIFEFTHNDESFHVAAPLSSRVDNDLYLLALHIGW
ncbi:MAG: hypothetical protein L6Q71_03730 [Planctomycetes bacterium]|nr:hypothetical protein [Planctomycetota bacterium]